MQQRHELHAIGDGPVGVRLTAAGRAEGRVHPERDGPRPTELDGGAGRCWAGEGGVGEPGELAVEEPRELGIGGRALAVGRREKVIL